GGGRRDRRHPPCPEGASGGRPPPRLRARTCEPSRRLRGRGGDAPGRLTRELLPVEPRIEPVLLEQLGVGAALDEASLVEDEDAVGGQDRGEPVGNRDRGA